MIATIALLSIFIAVAIGFLRDLNVGLVALVFAYFIGTYLGNLEAAEILSYWPLNLFFTTFGITFLFGIAKANGTLEQLSTMIIYQSKGSKIKIQILFYLLALVLASIGPGNISTGALLLPIGLSIAYQSGMSLLMMSTLIILGAIGGGVSPIAPNGIVALELARLHGIGELGLSAYLINVLNVTLFAIVFFVAMKGFQSNGEKIEITGNSPMTKMQKLTTLSIAVLVMWVIIGKVHVGFASFVLAAVLLMWKAADIKQAIFNVPWTTLLLICGTSLLIGVTSKLGGIDLLTKFLASLMNEKTAVPVLSLLTTTLALFASTVGVVMPTLIPTAVNLSNELSSVISPAVLTITIVVASHMVVMSPFSVMGALALAAVPQGANEKKLFRELFLVAFAGAGFVALFLTVIFYLGLLS